MSARIFDNLIIGTGVAGAATATALRRLGQSCVVLDVGNDIPEDRRKDVESLATSTPSQWDPDLVSRVFPPPRTSSKGVDERLSFGSGHPYAIPDALRLTTNNCDVRFSHALGGLGNVWGAAILPYNAHVIRDWPIPVEALNRAYRRVTEYMPMSGARDRLDTLFPVFQGDPQTIETSQQVAALLASLDRRTSVLEKLGITHGRARTAVNAAADSGCRYCGRCLDGCVYGAIFNPSQIWASLCDDVTIIKNQYVLEFEEANNQVSVTSIDQSDRGKRRWEARRVFCAAGHFGTTRLLARSLGLQNRAIRIQDSQYYFFPMISYRDRYQDARFTLAEVFLELLDESISEEYQHFQLYGGNEIFRQTLRKLLPRAIPVNPLFARFHLVQGYLHSRDSGYLEMTVRSLPDSDRVELNGIENRDSMHIARQSQGRIRKALINHGVVPPFYLNMVAPGRSFHTGGSFPMAGEHPTFSSDTLGRPKGLSRVHIVDAACFPNIPSSSMALNIMANADRIVHDQVRNQ